jgi:hypothetical protein
VRYELRFVPSRLKTAGGRDARDGDKTGDERNDRRLEARRRGLMVLAFPDVRGTHAVVVLAAMG